MHQLYVLVVIGILCSAAYADNDESIDFETGWPPDHCWFFDEMECTGKQGFTDWLKTPAVTVIGPEEIRRSGALSISDLLRRVPGLDVFQIKPGYPLVGSRGAAVESNRRVLVLVDGREVSMELAGFPFWSAPAIDINEILMIKVIRGPSTVLYGNNAVTAVVEISTYRPNKEFQFLAGEYGQIGLLASFGQNFELKRVPSEFRRSLDYGISIGHAAERSPSEFSGRVVYRPVRSHAYLRYGEPWGEYKFSLHAGTSFFEGLTHLQQVDITISDAFNAWVMAKAEFAADIGTNLKIQAYYSRLDADFRLRRDHWYGWLFWDEMRDYNLGLHTVDLKLHLAHRLIRRLQLLAGLELRYSALDWKGLVLEDSDEHAGSAFVQIRWKPLDTLQLTGGARLDFELDGGLTLGPAASVVFVPREDDSLHLSYFLGFRRASHLEGRVHALMDPCDREWPIFIEPIPLQCSYSMPASEKVHTVGAGWSRRHLLVNVHLSVDFYASIFTDRIDFQVDLPNRLGLPDLRRLEVEYRNSGQGVYSLGGEAELSWEKPYRWKLWANISVRKTDEIDSGKSLPLAPVFRANVGGHYRRDTGVVLGLSLHYVSSYQVPMIDPREYTMDKLVVELGDNLLCLGRIGYGFRLARWLRLESGLVVNVPIGAPFREYPGFPLAGESFQPQGGQFSDYAGELLTRRLSLYLRGSF